ncbi:MAG: response regulator [Halobacteriovoraceae bacterium]|nr:response regulator [Halobacteriovoraceae bacterium]MCB9095519.1 response regulator [Halobacteriovoraceae bacterium]
MNKFIIYKFIKRAKEVFEADFKSVTLSYVLGILFLVVTMWSFRNYRTNAYESIKNDTMLIRKLDAHVKVNELIFKGLVRWQLSADKEEFEKQRNKLIEIYDTQYKHTKKNIKRLIQTKGLSCNKDCQELITSNAPLDVKTVTFASLDLEQVESTISRFQREANDSSYLANQFELNVFKKINTLEEVDLYASVLIFILIFLEFFFIFLPSINRLMKAISMRSSFISRISHEIRNPMNAIIGMSEVLGQTDLNIEQKQYVRNINVAGDVLLGMLDNLIDFSALNKGKVVVDKKFFNLKNLVECCLDTISISAHQKGLEVFVHTSHDLDFEIKSDEAKLEQVLMNLLGNAVKFTAEGYVDLEINLVEEKNNKKSIHFSIIDTGIGVSEKSRKSIFQSFVQADSSIKRKYGGSGLGLSIVSEILSLLGTKLELESEEKKGSKFHFEILTEWKRLKEPEAKNKRKSKKKFYFICHQDYIESYQKTFKNFPVQVLTPSRISEIEKEQAVLFFDDSLNVVEIVDLSKKFQKQKEFQVYGVLKSCFSRENIDLLKKKGVKKFLIKPIKSWKMKEYLFRPIESELKMRIRTDKIDMVKLSKIKDKNLNILVVDDAEENLFLFKEFLQPISENIMTALNGAKALEAFKMKKFDIVLMDLQMPVMDGYSAVLKMNSIEKQRGQAIPKFAVTAHASEYEKRKCLRAGFQDRLIKPISQKSLFKLFLELFDTTKEEAMEIDSDIYDSEIIAKLLPRYIEARQEDLKKMKVLIKKKNYDELSKYGHKIKGSALSYGFKNINTLGKALEDFAKDENYVKSLECICEIEEIVLKEEQKLSGAH